MVENNRALAIRPLTPDAWQMIQSVSPVIHASRLFGVSSKEAAAAIALKGYELGMGIGASYEFIQVVEGKPTLSPRGALALILKSGLCDGLKIEDKSDGCTVWMKRKGGYEYALTWTVEDARRAGLVKPRGAWESYPANMCRWRAIGFVADVLFSDVLGGLKRADELGADIDGDGNVVEGEWRSVPQVQIAPTEASSSPEASPPKADQDAGVLDGLLSQYGPDAVLAANEGRIPTTPEELAAVQGKLSTSAEAR